MPRPALSKVSAAALLAEVERRISKQASLIGLRDDLDRQIEELKALTGTFAEAGPPAPLPTPVVRRRRRKVKAATKPLVSAPVARPAQSRAGYAVTGEQFILAVLQAKPKTTSQLSAAWKEAGRGSPVDNDLSRLFRAGKINRTKLTTGRGSTYSLAGKSGRRSPVGWPAKAVAKPVAVASGPVQKKKGKRGVFKQTAQEFILGLLKDKTLTSSDLKAAWQKAGRGGTVDSDLSNLFKAGKITREKLGGRLGSKYSLA